MSPGGNPRAGFGNTHGARVMDSTPPVSTTSPSPDSTVRDPAITESRLEQHKRFIVVAGTLTASPASRTVGDLPLSAVWPRW